MARRNTSAARRLQAAPVRRPEGVLVRMPQRQAVRRPRKRRNLGRIIKTLFFAATATLVLYAMVDLNAQITQQGERANKLQAQIQEERSENIRLNMEIEAMMSVQNIEEYAINELGMQKVNKSQISYLNLDQEDHTEVIRDDGGALGVVEGFLGKFFSNS